MHTKVKKSSKYSRVANIAVKYVILFNNLLKNKQSINSLKAKV